MYKLSLEIVQPLLLWYQENKRLLPWRMDKDPYHVWLSEIMLQQTRIEAVKGYYARFMEALPTIADLAEVKEDTLLKLWEGLGYYNRARNLQKAAKMIMEQYEGCFPNTYESILELPGIGEYTAGAIGSICFSLPRTAIDGNVLRVVMRLLNCYDNIDEGKTKEKVKEMLLAIMPKESGDFNEAIMELGETICLPNAIPLCDTCPLQEFCLSKKHNTSALLPVRNEKKAKKIEYLTLFLFTYQQQVAIEKRHEKGLLHNLWQFPNVEGKLSQEDICAFLKENAVPFQKINKEISYQHVFTHKIWNVQVYWIELENILSSYVWKNLSTIKSKYAIPTAFVPALKELEKMEKLWKKE